jgi:hypothetical protein
MASAPERRSAWRLSPGQRAARVGVRVLAEQRARCAQFFRSGFRSPVSPEPVRRRAGRAAAEEQAVPFRQLRRLPAGAGGQQRGGGSRRAGAPGSALPNSSGVYTPVANLNPAMLPICLFGPSPTVRKGWSAACPPARRWPTTIPASPSARISAPRAPTTRWAAIAIGFAGIYTIDDGNSLIPLSDPLFASYEALRAQVASAQETHVFSPRFLNTFDAGFSRAGFNLDSSPLASFPASDSFVSGLGAWRNRDWRRRHYHRAGSITSAGPNNAAGAWTRRNLFTWTDSVQIVTGKHQIELPECGFSGSRITTTPLRANWDKPVSPA